MKSKVTVGSIIKKKSVKPNWVDLEIGTFFIANNDNEIRIKTHIDSYMKFQNLKVEQYSPFQYESLYDVIILDVEITATEQV